MREKKLYKQLEYYKHTTRVTKLLGIYFLAKSC